MSSRALSRVRALIAVVPLLVATGPVVAAHAAGEYTVANLMLNGQVVGPNTGYLGLGTGQGGSTAMFSVTPPTTGASISSLEVTLTQVDNPSTFIYQHEFDGTDGLALYADTNNSNSFDAADKAAGPKSNGYRATSVAPNGDVTFLVTFAAPVSGFERYYIALHPAAGADTGEKFTFRVEAGDVDGSAGDGPAAAVSTPAKTANSDPRIVVDASAPAAAPPSAFTAISNNPGTNDKYTVAPSAAGGDSTVKIGFFNAESTTAPTALLTRPGFDGTVAVASQLDKVAFETLVDPDSPSSPHDISIGDGSGLVPGVAGLAHNNQINNAVFARLVDSAGNISEPTVLSDCLIVSPATTCDTARGNPVIGPETPTAAELTSGTTAINLDNFRAVPVTVTSSANAVAARTTRSTASATNADTSSQAVLVKASIQQVDAAGAINADRGTALKQKSYAAGATSVSFSSTTTDGFDTLRANSVPKGIDEGTQIAVVVGTNYDRAGNSSAAKQSATPYTKDITAPTLTVGTNVGGTMTTGNTVTLQFSEAMNKASITERKTVNMVTGGCETESGTRGLNSVLPVTSSANAARTWGYDNCFTWGPNGSTATVKIGNKTPQGCLPAGNPCTAFPAIGDHVNYVGAGSSDLRDVAGNLIVDGSGSTTGFTLITVPPASPTGGVTKDLITDGKLDAVELTFSQGVNLDTFGAAQSNFSAQGPVPVAIDSVTPVTGTQQNATVVRFNFTSDFGTGVLPTITLVRPVGAANTGFKDANGANVEPFAFLPTDGALPQPVTALTQDTSSPKDGRIDHILLTYSEPIVPAQDNNRNNVDNQSTPTTNLTGPAYFVNGYAPTNAPGMTEGRNVVGPTTGSPNAVKDITLVPKTAPTVDTNATPVVKFTLYTQPGTGTKYAPTDSIGNVWDDADHTFSITATDGTGPVIVSRVTRDLDSDGAVDGIDVTLSEDIPTLAALTAAFTVTGHTITGQEPLSTNGIRLFINETAAPGTGDTAASMAPTVQYVGGQIKDTLGNAMTAEPAAVASTDGAGPAIVGACASSPKGSNGLCPEDDPAVATDDGAKMNVFFSEALTTSSVDTNASDFVVQQPSGTTKTVTSASATNATDGKSATVTLTMAAGTLSSLSDAVVRLADVNKVTDLASPTPLGNTQIANVVAPAPPKVSMTVTCPVASNPGYCSGTFLNIAAGVVAGSVTGWKLADSPTEPPTPALTDFTAPAPTRYPGTGTITEGDHKLWLRGRDAFNRISASVSSAVTVLRPPQLLNIAMSNSNGNRAGAWPRTGGSDQTVLDGDLIRITGDAYGTDAADWAANKAPTGGGCNPANMSVDLRAVTGVANQSAVAPFKCDLTITSSPPHRHMEFPLVGVTKTTRYPVGTVLRTSSSDPGSMIVDGPGGTSVRRRQFISINARRSWQIPDAQVITVPASLINAISRSSNIGYRDGAIVRVGGTSSYYYVIGNVKRPVAPSTLSYWKIPLSHVYVVSAGEAGAMSTGTGIGRGGHQPGMWIKFSNGSIQQIVRLPSGRAVRRGIASQTALATLVPLTHIYPANANDGALPADSWVRGYRDGTVLKVGSGYGVVSRASLRRFESLTTMVTLGFNTSNAIAFATSAMPHASGHTFRTGVIISRYKITTVVVKVTNKAGDSRTAIVTPVVGGIYGVGTFDPIPPGWDPSR